MRDQLLQRQNAQQQRSQKVRGPSRDTAIPGREIGRQFWTKYSSVVCDLAVCSEFSWGRASFHSLLLLTSTGKIWQQFCLLSLAANAPCFASWIRTPGSLPAHQCCPPGNPC